jgi:hypothetical protein
MQFELDWIGLNLNWILQSKFNWGQIQWNWIQKHWIELKYIWVEVKSIGIRFEFNWIPIWPNSMQIQFEKKWGAIWCNKTLNICTLFPSFMSMVFKKKALKKHNTKEHFSIPFKADSTPESSSIGWNSTRPYNHSTLNQFWYNAWYWNL